MDTFGLLRENINQSVLQLGNVDAALERKAILKIKREIVTQIDELRVTEDKKSYLLHQLNNVHSTHELNELMKVFFHKEHI